VQTKSRQAPNDPFDHIDLYLGYLNKWLDECGITNQSLVPGSRSVEVPEKRRMAATVRPELKKANQTLLATGFARFDWLRCAAKGHFLQGTKFAFQEDMLLCSCSPSDAYVRISWERPPCPPISNSLLWSTHCRFRNLSSLCLLKVRTSSMEHVHANKETIKKLLSAARSGIETILCLWNQHSESGQDRGCPEVRGL
jgi:hypothetical protein